MVLIAMRVHLFPSRTQKLSSSAPTIVAGRLAVKIGNANTKQDRKLSLAVFLCICVVPGMLPDGSSAVLGRTLLRACDENVPGDCHVGASPLLAMTPEYSALTISVVGAIIDRPTVPRWEFYNQATKGCDCCAVIVADSNAPALGIPGRTPPGLFRPAGPG